jgi:hypothetical protein
MQRHTFGILFTWLISLHRAVCVRMSAQGKMTGTAASPTLTFAAIVHFLILAILEIDLHRDVLRALGLTADEEGIVSSLVGP